MPPAELICMAILCLPLPLSTPLWSETCPITVNENVPPQDIAGTDGNQGERDPVGIANEVEGRKELVGGNTDGGKVVADGGKNPVPGPPDCDGNVVLGCWNGATGTGFTGCWNVVVGGGKN